MISINKLPQAKKRLEEDLQRVFNSAYKTYNDTISQMWDLNDFPEEILLLRGKTEDEIIEFSIEQARPDLSEAERKKLKSEREAIVREQHEWKSFLRFINILSRQTHYTSAFPRLFATLATIIYDAFAHPILFSNWRWKKDEFDLKDLDLQLSPEEVCDRIFDCNPDLVSVLINKLEDCSIADREILQSAFETSNREAFIKSLKGLSVSDYNSLVLCVTCLHLDDIFISFDLEKIEILQNHIDFGDQMKLGLSTLLKESKLGITAIESSKNPSPYKGDSSFDSYCASYEPILDSLRDDCAEPLLRLLPIVFEELIKPCPFPFEREYLDDLLNDPDVKTILEELPENPIKISMSPEDQEQPTETERQLDNQKKRSLDDFDFVKDAHFDTLYNSIKETLALYDKALYHLFCGNCRLPLEQALYEFYHIAGITGKKIPDLQSGMIARLSIYLPEEVFPSSYKALYTDLNKLTGRYHHAAKYPQEDEWHEDAKKCYQLMIQCFHQLVEFKKEYPHYVAINGPIDFQKNITRVLAAKRDLPLFNSATYSRQPDYTSIALAHINLKESYKESLELELPVLYETIFDAIKDTYDYLIEALKSSFSIDNDSQYIANLEYINEFVPQVLATRHLHSYYSLIHSILFRDSWNPQEIADSAFAGTNPYIDDIFWGLININHFASKVVIDKLSGNELTRKAIKENIDEDEKGLAGFRRNYEKLPPKDHLVLDAIGHFKRFLIERDCGALIKVKEQTIKCIATHSVSTADIEETINALIFVSISELYNATKNEEWEMFFPFEKKYVLDLLDNQFAIPYLTELRKSEDRKSEEASEGLNTVSMNSSILAEDNPSESAYADLAGFHFALPEDLFSGKVDIRHDFIPGLKNVLKTIDVFSPLFNYILNLGGINSNKEAGALLRTFTGYPVEDADEKAKWGTDYHILYYLIKYMFTPKKSYVKMSKCIDIYYPSDDERLKAERSPSSYAERISGSDAPSVIETLYRLSGVFPKPEEPVTD